MEESYALYELFAKQAFTIPLWQVILLTVISSICLTRKMQKTGLIVTYFFLFYWGFVFNRPYFSDQLGSVSMGYVLYALFGLAMLTILFISFFKKDSDMQREYGSQLIAHNKYKIRIFKSETNPDIPMWSNMRNAKGPCL